MITAAAICPCPPLLIRELTGRDEVLPELRAACAAAVARLTASGADVIAVTGPAEVTGEWAPDARLDLTAYAPALGPAALVPGQSGVPGQAGPVLPLSLGVGLRLLDEAGYTGPRAVAGIAAQAPAGECLRLGTRIAAAAPRVALLAMGDGSARRSVSAPGYLDERAAPFDAAVESAVRHGDVAALAGLDPDLAGALLAAGRPAWQVLAGALGTAGSRPQTEILYAGAPLGVAYLVASLSPRAAAPPA
jgi:hypothetical protein